MDDHAIEFYRYPGVLDEFAAIIKLCILRFTS